MRQRVIQSALGREKADKHSSKSKGDDRLDEGDFFGGPDREHDEHPEVGQDREQRSDREDVNVVDFLRLLVDSHDGHGRNNEQVERS